MNGLDKQNRTDSGPPDLETGPGVDFKPPETGRSLLYGLNDRPPWGRTILYGAQWLVIFLPMLAVVAALAGRVLGFGPEAQTAFSQRLFLVSGATICAQTLWGHRLPLLDGPAMALVVTWASLGGAGLGVIGGGTILGGVLVFLCGALGLTGRLATWFTDRVVGVILLLIGLTILPHLVPMLLGVGPNRTGGSPVVLAAGLALILAMSLMFHHFRGVMQSLALFFSVVAGSVAFAALGWMDFSSVVAAPWFTYPDPRHDPPMPIFDPAAALSFALAYLAVIVNATGSLFSVERLVNADRMDRRLGRAMMVTGLSGIVSGGAGVVGTVPYSLSPGIITVTGVGSRHTVTACGLGLIALAFLGKLAALIAAVPGPVVAAALIASLAAGVGVSLNLIQRAGRLNNRDYLVVGLPILLGMAAGSLPADFLATLPASWRPLAGNGLIVGVVAVLGLEHLVLRAKNTANQT